jgi:hypothetical protein
LSDKQIHLKGMLMKEKLGFGEGFTFGLGFWSAGLIINVILGVLVFIVLLVLPALGCGLLGSLSEMM